MAPTQVRICYTGLMPLIARPWGLESQIRKRFPEQQFPELELITDTKLSGEDVRSFTAEGGLQVVINGQTIPPHKNHRGKVDTSETVADVLKAISEQLAKRRTMIVEPSSRRMVKFSQASTAVSRLGTVQE